jgi:CubicO group peptidase (beta-lactamase class C family)
VIEQISGDPWEVYVQKNIFAPLGLTRSYFGNTPYYLASDRSRNYTVGRDSAGRPRVNDNGADFDPGITIPNGGWNAPLADLVAYLGFLTGTPRGDAELAKRHAIVLDRKSLEEMWEPVIPRGSTQREVETVGLSFFRRELGEGAGRLIGHTGSQAGFLSFLYFNPATSTGIVATFNTNGSPRPAPSSTAYRTILDAAIKLIE